MRAVVGLQSTTQHTTNAIDIRLKLELGDHSVDIEASWVPDWSNIMKVDERRNALNSWNCRDEHSRQLRA
jgi:hypothetical protein